MNLPYGIVKCQVVSAPRLQHKRLSHETQYHLHADLSLGDGGGVWDCAINVGTDDSDDLLNYKMVYDFSHGIIGPLKALPMGFTDLTGKTALPALDFLRSDLLKGTGPWRVSGIMDGTDAPDPCASLKRLLEKAQAQKATVYLFGRTYSGGDLGIHDIHMNQGSAGPRFFNDDSDNRNDHNDVWQDGAVLVDLSTEESPAWAAYFTAFTQQTAPTDELGNPKDGGHAITVADEGSER